MSDMTKRNFLGIPVSGTITAGSTRVEQKPVEELAPLLQAVLDYPTIVEFGWRQYTPYFNDGDPCEFGVDGLWVKTTAEAELEEAGEADFGPWDLDVDYHPSLGKLKWNSETYKYEEYEGPDVDRYNRIQALARAIQSGAYENALLEAFGDHAEVTIRKSDIQVEFYSHE